MDRLVPLADIMSALSYALDIVEGQPAGHCIRCCWIGIRIGRALGLDDARLSSLYYTIMLKDLGCSSNAARICSHYMTDDIAFKRSAKLLDGSIPAVLRFVLDHTGLQANMAERFKAIYVALKTGPEVARELIETRCTRGAEIAKQLRFSDEVARAIHCLDEYWNGAGKPDRLAGHDIPQFSQIALLSQVVDVFHTASGQEQALSEIRSRSGSWFDPHLVEVFEQVSAAPGFWRELASDDLDAAVLSLEPARERMYADEDYLDDIATAFAQVIDAKSPFTAGHSDRVMVYADMIANEMGCDPEHRRFLRRASLLHDIGKLGISNSILDKPDKLNDDEFATIKRHPVYSAEILFRISAFEGVVPIARGHHERLDGKGYPDGLVGDEIDMNTRIVTVADIFDALTADRPYRKAMPQDKAMSILDDMSGSAIDGDCLKALKSAIAVMETGAA